VQPRLWADATELEAIDAIEGELRDRFGPLPEEGSRLVDLRRLRVLGASMGITSILLRKGLFEVQFAREMTSEEVRALLRATSTPVEFSSTGDHGFRITRFREGSSGEALRLLRTIAAVARPADPADADAVTPPGRDVPSGTRP